MASLVAEKLRRGEQRGEMQRPWAVALKQKPTEESVSTGSWLRRNPIHSREGRMSKRLSARRHRGRELFESGPFLKGMVRRRPLQ